MISIIIASVKSDMLANVSENISNTIGVEFEIISFDNSNGEKGLCELYNLGAKRARYNNLCFMHEDIKIKTNNWGNIVLECFNNRPKLGVLGVAGSAYKSFAPSGWGIGGERHTEFYNYIQTFKAKDKPSIHAYLNVANDDFKNAVTVDGMWFCTTKEIAVAHQFDENTFKRFHCYDLDYCLNVGQIYDVGITFDILIEHFSEGGYTKEWFFETLKLHNKWQYMLPKSTIEIPRRIKYLIERKAYLIIFSRLISFNFNKKYIVDFFEEYRAKSKMSFWMGFKLKYKLSKLLRKANL
ncbi:MAG: glycosyltransferase [Bacteroidota bacterium]